MGLKKVSVVWTPQGTVTLKCPSVYGILEAFEIFLFSGFLKDPPFPPFLYLCSIFFLIIEIIG